MTALNVGCPTCKASAGRDCRTWQGDGWNNQPRATAHPKRVRAAGKASGHAPPAAVISTLDRRSVRTTMQNVCRTCGWKRDTDSQHAADNALRHLLANPSHSVWVLQGFSLKSSRSEAAGE